MTAVAEWGSGRESLPGRVDVCLVNVPYASLNRPPLALGLLTAILEREGNRETLRSLEESNLRGAGGAAAAAGSVVNPCTNVISDCYACTGRLDTCPDPTIVVS